MRRIDPIRACCPPILENALQPFEAEQLAAAFKVIAESARLRLLSMIASHPNGEACVCDLVTPLGLSQPTVSHHLQVLHEAGLLERERRGTWIYYRVVPGRLQVLRDPIGAPAATPIIG